MTKAQRCKMPAVAMTDHGNLFGAIDFYKQATKAGIKPIIGCEVYLAPGSMKDKKRVPGLPNCASSHAFGKGMFVVMRIWSGLLARRIWKVSIISHGLIKNF